MPQVDPEPLGLGDAIERVFVATNRSQQIVDAVAEPGKHLSLHGHGGEIRR